MSRFDEDDDVEAYRRAVNRIVAITLDPEASARFLADVASRLERT